MPGGDTYDFYIGSALSNFLFTLVMDELKKGIQDELHVYYTQMTLFLLMKPQRELMISWSDGDIH